MTYFAFLGPKLALCSLNLDRLSGHDAGTKPQPWTPIRQPFPADSAQNHGRGLHVNMRAQVAPESPTTRNGSASIKPAPRPDIGLPSELRRATREIPWVALRPVE
jgi:hypothetical protein